MATPPFLEWTRNARYREAARDIASALRDARTTAITRNLECQVEFDLAGRQYRTTLGNRSTGSSDFNTILRGWKTLPSTIILRRNGDCASSADVNLQFNPNGSAASGFVCIMDASPTPARKFQVGVPSSTTGRVVITN
jgi:Tfp pilus assembly protein FimT